MVALKSTRFFQNLKWSKKHYTKAKVGLEGVRDEDRGCHWGLRDEDRACPWGLRDERGCPRGLSNGDRVVLRD